MSNARVEDLRLSSTQTFDFAFTKLLEAQKHATNNADVTIIEPAAGESIYGARFKANGKYITLLNPACDKDKLEHTNDIGTTPLAITLERIRFLQQANPDDIFLIPMSETQPIVFFTRDHWVVLMIQRNECNFYDPCAANLWSFKASSLYPLGTMRRILTTNQFTITDEVYLGWQNDSVNCGRYCGAIVSEIANLFFDDSEFSSMTTNLKRVMPKSAEELVEESTLSTANKLIFGNKLICELRQQEFLADKFTRANLSSPLYPTQPQQKTLTLAIENNFIEKGKKNNLKQFIRDFPCLKFKLMGKSFNELGGDAMTDSKIASALGWSNSAVSIISNIISAHSQGPFAFLPFILAQGIIEHDPKMITIPQVTEESDYSFNITRTQRGPVLLVLEYKRFPIKSVDSGKIIGHIEGSTIVTYRHIQIAKDEWGWQLDTIVTKNNDIKRLLTGARLSQQYLFTNYCQTEKKTMPSSLVLDNKHFATAEAKAALAIEEEKQKAQAEQKTLEETSTLALLNRKEQQLQSLKQTNADLYQIITAETGKVESLKLELHALQQIISRLTSINNALEVQQEEAASKLTLKDKSNAELRDANSQFSATNAQLSLKVQQTQQQVADLEQQHKADIEKLAKQTNDITLKDMELSQLTAENTRLILRNRQHSQLLQNIRAQQSKLTIPKQPLQPVFYYVAGTILSTALTITGSLITLGIVNLSILAAIPVAGWALATGFSLALAGMFLVKSIANALTNAELAKAPVPEQKDPLSPDINSDEPDQSPRQERAVDFSARRNSREALGFHKTNSSSGITAPNAAAESSPTQSRQPG
jgi:hypothetical protein